jgi:hypothetical protein
VLSTPYMMFASMIEIVIMPRFGTGVNASPLINRPRDVKATRRTGGSRSSTRFAGEGGLMARLCHVFLPKEPSPLRSHADWLSSSAGKR